jgi:hypothetical protein
MFKNDQLRNDYWITTDGRKLYPEEMSNSHIVNTIMWLETHADSIKNDYDLSLAESPAFYKNGKDITSGTYIEPLRKAIAALWSQSPIDFVRESRIYTALLNEASARGLIDLIQSMRSRNAEIKEPKIGR